MVPVLGSGAALALAAGRGFERRDRSCRVTVPLHGRLRLRLGRCRFLATSHLGEHRTVSVVELVR